MPPPRILHDLGRELSGILEGGLSESGEPPVPVFLCHPLDPIDELRDSPSGAFGVLYLASIVPEPRYRQNTPELERDSTVEGLGERLRRPPLWVRLRYVFLVAGGDAERQLIALAGALQTLHDTPELEIALGGERVTLGEPDPAEPDPAVPRVRLPLALVDSTGDWRELGLTEHRLSIAFDVVCPIESARVETVRRTEERGLSLEIGSHSSAE